MKPGGLHHRLLTAAPARTGALLCSALTFLFTSCEKKTRSPDWDAPDAGKTAEVQPSAEKEKPSRHSEPSSSSEAFRFIGYNLENWLTMDRFVDRNQVKDAPKPESEKNAVIKLIVSNKPDVFGFCEIGSEKDFTEVKDRLKSAGLDLPHSYYTGGSDATRHLGFLSRFPIISTAKPAETEYQLNGQTFSINRGILDVTIKANGKPYRFIGVHLKSKRAVEEGDQEEMRIHEAHLLRRHLDWILKADPEARLVVYGDFNDTRPSKAFKTATGNYTDPGYLTAIPMKDSRGEAWTHYWQPHDVYSRIDYIAVTKTLRSEVDFNASRIIDDSEWNSASDHRPVMAIFK
jgi:endonuclease/exonuclease/phosphatase family metal-dependent hydrolase